MKTGIENQSMPVNITRNLDEHMKIFENLDQIFLNEKQHQLRRNKPYNTENDTDNITLDKENISESIVREFINMLRARFRNFKAST